MKKTLFWRWAKISVSALLMISMLCTVFSVVAITDLVKDNPVSSISAVADIAQAQTDSTYSLAYDDILAQETAAATAYGYSYNSVSAVEAGITATQVLTSETWHFGRQNLAQNDGVYLPDGNVSDQSIWKQNGWYSSLQGVRNAHANMLYVWDSGDGEGLGVYNSKVFTFAGNKTNHASALIFVAPETGKIHLMPTTFEALSAEGPFFTLQDETKTTGVVIYKNGEKVWPTDSDYYTLTNTTRSVTTPDLSVEVAAGDKIYYKLIPLTEYMGYYTLDPVITYQRIGAPVDYSWSYSEKSIALDAVSGQYLPTGNWTQPELYHVSRMSDNNNATNAHPNYLTTKWQGNVGFGTHPGENEFKNDILTFIKGDRVSGITYTAPKNGTVMLSDAMGGSIEGIYWGLSVGGNYTYGFAVYKNEEKIWPADGFLTTTSNIAFPVVPNIQVNEGDKITFAMIPLGGASYAFAHFSPQVTYQTVGTQTGSLWSFCESSTVTEESTGYQISSGEWEEIAVGRGICPGDNATLRSASYLQNFMYVHGGKDGIGVYNNKIITFMGKKATALTYTAPLTGSIRLSDALGGDIGAIKGNPFYTLDNETVGVTVYQNNTKVWPTNSDYYVLNSEISAVAFPDLLMNVAAGDKIRIAMHPLSNCSWGYMLSGTPQIEYLFTTYSGAADAVAYQETKPQISKFDDSFWSYEEKSIAQSTINIDGSDTDVYLPTGDWSSPSIYNAGYCDHSDAVRSAVPNMFYIWNSSDKSGRGLASYEGRVITYVGANNNVAPTLTYTAPLSGTVNLSSDDLVGRIGGSTFITLHEGGMIGFAIYKNNERIWPNDGEINDFHVFHIFHGQIWDSTTQSYSDLGNVDTQMPELNLQVNAGDKIRFMFVALQGINWGYMALDPHIQYTAVNGWGDQFLGIMVEEPAVKQYYEIEDYDFSDMVVKRLKADGTSTVIPSENIVVDAPKEIGKNSVTVQYTENGVSCNRNFYVTVLDTVYGDVNFDGTVDTSDLVDLRKHLLGQSTDIHVAVADVTDDNIANVKDLIRIKKYFADSAIILGPVTKWIDPLPQYNREAVTVTRISQNGKYIEKSGEPYLQYGVQIVPDRSFTSLSEKEQEMFYQKAAEIGFKKVIVAAKWRLIEPLENQYNLYSIDRMIYYANKYDLDLEILWFGGNVCGSTANAPNYVLNDTVRFPMEGTDFDYSNQTLLQRESNAISVMMNYIYDVDTNHRVSMVQIENEPNTSIFRNGQSTQKAAFLNYLDAMGLAVKNSPYKVLTRVNLIINDSYLETSNTLPEEILALNGIDMVGPDVYTTRGNYYNQFIERFSTGTMAGNIMHFAEAPGQVDAYLKLVMNALSKQSGYYTYELKTFGNTKFDLGIFRKSNGWVKRDGTQNTSFEWQPNNLIPETVTDDVIVLNNMIAAVEKQLVLCGQNIAAIAADASAVVSDKTFGFSSTAERTANHMSIVLFCDGYYYLFTPAATGTFTFGTASVSGTASVGSFVNGEWTQTSTAQIADNSLSVTAGNVYRIASSQIQ